jgi:ubiquinone biosynthesis protein UbiJ
VGRAQRATSATPTAEQDAAAQPPLPEEESVIGAHSELELDDVLAVFDDLAEDADALNARIQSLLAGGG